MDDDQWLTDDDSLLEALREALREDWEVPEHVVLMGRAAFTWRDADHELAALVADSSADALLVAGSRAADQAELRELTFALRDTLVHVQVGDRVLQGQLVPPRPGRVELHEDDAAPRGGEIDEHGWFSIAPLPVRGFRLRWRTTDGWTATTAHLTL